MLSGGEVFKARKRIGPGSPRPGSFCVQAGRPGKLQPSSAESPPTVPLLSPQVTSPYTITPASSLHPPRRAHPPRASHPAHPIPASAPPCTPRPLPTYSTLHPASGGQWSGSIAELLCHRVLRGFRTLRHSRGDDGQLPSPLFCPSPSMASLCNVCRRTRAAAAAAAAVPKQCARTVCAADRSFSP